MTFKVENNIFPLHTASSMVRPSSFMPVETVMVIPGDRLDGEPAVCTTGTLLREDPVSSDHQEEWDTLIAPTEGRHKIAFSLP